MTIEELGSLGELIAAIATLITNADSHTPEYRAFVLSGLAD